MTFPEMVWTCGPNGWHSRALTDGDRERRKLVMRWITGEITYKQLACMVRDGGLIEVKCAQ